jgi:hypothetical protein
VSAVIRRSPVRVLFAAAVLLAASNAFAEEIPRLAVLPIIVPGTKGGATLSSVIDDVGRATAFRRMKLASNEEMFAAGSGDLSSRVRDCGSDIGCIAERLRAFDARFGLVVVVNAALDPPLISLQLLDIDDRKMIAQNAAELAPEEKTISEAVSERAKKIFEQAGWPQLGRIVVEVAPARAKITLGDQAPDEGAPNVFTVSPGRYLVRAELDGYASGSAEAVAIAGKDTRVGLTLEEEKSLLSSPWLWAAIGVAAAGGAAAAIIATRPTERCLCITVNGSACGCDP